MLIRDKEETWGVSAYKNKYSFFEEFLLGGKIYKFLSPYRFYEQKGFV